MPEEGLFILSFENKNIWFAEKNHVFLNYCESYDNFKDFMAAILIFSF